MASYQSKSPTATSFGSWESPFTPEVIAAGSLMISDLFADGEDTYFVESRPANKGQNTIVRLNKDGKLEDVTPPEFNARTSVHEYGGKSYTVLQGTVYFFNAKDSAVYKVEKNAHPIRLTSERISVVKDGKNLSSGVYFGDFQPFRNNLIAVGEEYGPDKDTENFLSLIDTKSGGYKKIAEGHDFFASPAISRDGKKIAWITWDHPNMPWTSTKLWTADIAADGKLSNQKLIAGMLPESIMQPEWSEDGTLYFITDRDKGWWNIHRFQGEIIENMTPIEAEVGEPLWILGRTAYAFLNDKILFTFNKDARWHLSLLDTKTKKTREISRPSVYMHQLKSDRTGYQKGKSIVRYMEGFADKDDAVMQMTLENDSPDAFLNALPTVLYEYSSQLPSGYISTPQHMAAPSNQRLVFGLYYPPCNKDFVGKATEKPPLIITVHGGPTAQAKNVFSLKQQYWTSRGFAVLDVNYGGSTGYGRAYRSLLKKNWGIVDVADCINSAKYLIEKGLADKNRIVIRGGSAGGFTTLAALSSTNLFKAGASYYGVADITVLANDTHKFESYYMEELVGKFPEEKQTWEERSPINAVDKILTPLIIFQGEDDLIVPKNQSEMIYDALKDTGVPVEIYIYPNEGHGFRQAATIIDSLQKELNFYLKVFGDKEASL